MDNIQGMAKLGKETVDLTVTSPPYDDLRNYKGYSFDFERTARGLYWVTKLGGVVVWVVGDATKNGSESGTSFKQALYFKEIGFNIHDTMIYLKKDFPPLTHNRYEQQFEYMFVFTKGKLKTFNGIKIPTKYGGELRNKKNNKQEPSSAIRGRDGYTEIKETKLMTNVWLMSGAHTKIDHPAIFPEELAEKHILSWSNENDLVLDPFMGSGTTALMAKKLNRKYIGFEISQEYCDIANKRLEMINTL